MKPTQQVWGRLFHQLVHTALAHSYLPLHRHCYLYYQVQLLCPSKFWKLAQTAQITKIHETINSTESAKSQLLDALGWRWRTGSLQNKVAPNSRIQSYWVENLPSLAMFGGFKYTISGCSSHFAWNLFTYLMELKFRRKGRDGVGYQTNITVSLSKYFQGLMRQEQTDYLFAHTKVYVG